jgi:hypothetical protein
MITIANKLAVRAGNIISIPGCEPLSGFSSNTLAANMSCKSSVITLGAALEAIPGSTVEMSFNPKMFYFVLPEGPPTVFGCNTCDSGIDWYQILRDASIPLQPQEPNVPGPCDAFPIPRC